MQLYSRTRGTGPTLLMLHGLFGSADNLGGIARILEADFQIITADLRNHGRSPHDAHISYDLMADDVRRLMDREGIQHAHVFGHSMGGKVAMQLALSYPDRVDRLVVADIAPVAYARHHDMILKGLRAVAEAAPTSRAEAEAILGPFVADADILSFLLTNWRRREDGSQGWRMNLDAIEEEYAQIAAGNHGGPFMGKTLFLRGGDSDYVTSDSKDVILSLFPKAAVRTIEGTGHWLHAEKPELVARLISRFLNE